MASTDNHATPFFRQRLVVIAVSLLAMLSATAAVWLAWRAWPEMPVREVVFVNVSAAPFVHLKTEELTRVARAIATAKVNLLHADLNEIKTVVEQVAWVRSADVRRRLPGKIEVSIEEHVPFGVWRTGEKSVAVAAMVNADVSKENSAENNTSAGELANQSASEPANEPAAAANSLINTFGEVFKATLPKEVQATLPVLGGPLDSSKEVIVIFDQFRKQLAAIQRKPGEVQLSVRRAWTIKLDNGITLELGRNDAEQRLQRFTRAYAQIADLQTTGINVDLRYASGLALQRSSSSRLSAFNSVSTRVKPAPQSKTPPRIKKAQKAKRI